VLGYIAFLLTAVHDAVVRNILPDTIHNRGDHGRQIGDN
jgi:hypothetical protein